MGSLNFLKPNNTLEEGGRDYSFVPVKKEEKKEVCPNCHKEIPRETLKKNLYVCKCGHHFRISARKRIEVLTSEGTFKELFSDIEAADPLVFYGYKGKLEKAREASKEKESVICGRAKIEEEEFALFAMDTSFMMGSMGSATGEKITLLFEYATKHRLPVVGFTASGGARMQEGLLSLMQMAKTSAAVKRHSGKGLLFVVVLTDPTTGGVTASFAMEGDIILAEPGAVVGFAGKRVIEQTVRETLPPSFQTAEFVLEHGFIDSIVPRTGLKETLLNILKLHKEVVL